MNAGECVQEKVAPILYFLLSVVPLRPAHKDAHTGKGCALNSCPDPRKEGSVWAEGLGGSTSQVTGTALQGCGVWLGPVQAKVT